MTIPLPCVCLSCRKYGVRLIDNLCEPCYYHPMTIGGLQPGKLPRKLDGDDKRTTLGSLDRLRHERNMQ